MKAVQQKTATAKIAQTLNEIMDENCNQTVFFLLIKKVSVH